MGVYGYYYYFVIAFPRPTGSQLPSLPFNVRLSRTRGTSAESLCLPRTEHACPHLPLGTLLGLVFALLPPRGWEAAGRGPPGQGEKGRRRKPWPGAPIGALRGLSSDPALRHRLLVGPEEQLATICVLILPSCPAD